MVVAMSGGAELLRIVIEHVRSIMLLMRMGLQHLALLVALLLRVHDHLEHFELVFLHRAHMLHLLLVDALVLVNHAAVSACG